MNAKLSYLTALGVGVILAAAIRGGVVGWRMAHADDLAQVKAIRLHTPEGAVRALSESDWRTVCRSAASSDWRAACRAFNVLDARNLSPVMKQEALMLAGDAVRDRARPDVVRSAAQAALNRLIKE